MTGHRLSLGGALFEYSEVDFLTPVESILPYRIINGRVVRHHTKAHAGARHPPDVSVYSQFLWGLAKKISIASPVY